MTAAKNPRLLPAMLLCAAAIIVGWWMQQPDVSPQDRQYYAALLCVAAGQTDDANQFDMKMREIIENGNSDYALKRTAYDEKAARSAEQRWQQLSVEQQQQAAKDQEKCRQLMATNGAT